MKLLDFYKKVEADEFLTGLDIKIKEHVEQDSVVVSTTGLSTELLVSSIIVHDWKTLQAVLMGQNQAQPIYHVSRVVGYFSRIENWNDSKLGELADRRKGNYSIEKGKTE